MLKNCFILFLIFFSASIFAQEVKFYGEAKQGGIIIGQGEDIIGADLNDTNLQVDKNGYFVFGFDRDAAGTFILKIHFKDRKTKTFKYLIHKLKYNVQKIRVAKDFINPPKNILEKIETESALMKEARSEVGRIDEALYAGGFGNPLDKVEIGGVFGVQRILNGKPSNIHNGLDYRAAEGDSIRAITDGIVRIAGEKFFYNGTFVLLDHGQGLTSVYLHMSKLLVSKGQKVSKGEVIGLVGSTGRATGPHLHLGVQWYKKRIDPVNLLSISLQTKQ